MRRGLIEPRAQHRRRYKRWERDAAMQLWQVDIMGGLFLADGTEVKVVTGIDDHSRFCVLATVVVRATSRAVCSAFADAMRRHGMPEEVLTDNGKQFTGRFNKPKAAEVLFERILRENGIAQRLTKPASPTTTGKIERFHKTLRVELLDHGDPFPDLAAAQKAIDAWVAEYNTARPHQSLDGATPAERFTIRSASAQNGADSDAQTLALHMPAELAEPPSRDAVEFDVVVPPSGNLWVAGRQLWLGTQRAGQTVTIWADLTSIHLSVDGVGLKTLPSRFTTTDLTKLRRRQGAHPGGPRPHTAVQAVTLTDADVIEVDRTVNASGVVALGKQPLCVGQQLAGRRIILRVEARLVHVLADGFLIRTLPSPIPAQARARLQGARLATGELPAPAGPTVIERKVACRGTIQVAGQKLQVGLDHAGKTVTVIIDDTSFQVLHDGVPLKTFPRTIHKEITRHKAYQSKSPRQADCQGSTEHHL